MDGLDCAGGESMVRRGVRFAALLGGGGREGVFAFGCHGEVGDGEIFDRIVWRWRCGELARVLV